MPPEDSPTRPDRFAGTSPNPIPDGGILDIRYLDEAKGGETVEVVATNGGDATETHTLQLALRGNGKGSTQFIVPPGWDSVELSAEDSATHVIDVAVPP